MCAAAGAQPALQAVALEALSGRSDSNSQMAAPAGAHLHPVQPGAARAAEAGAQHKSQGGCGACCGGRSNRQVT